FVPEAFIYFKKLQPINYKLTQFYEYFETTWIKNKVFTIELWNHWENNGPGTNNHVEGYNRKINSYIDYNHPHIYSAINTLKGLETTTSLNYCQRLIGGLTQFPRRTNAIQRDQIINRLFKYDKKSKSLNSDLPYFQIPNPELPSLSLLKISKQTYSFIKNYVIGNKKYANQKKDHSNVNILQKWNATNMVCVMTTGEGNCLYNAISISLCGNEELSKEIKLAMIFIYFEYEKKDRTKRDEKNNIKKGGGVALGIRTEITSKIINLIELNADKDQDEIIGVEIELDNKDVLAICSVYVNPDSKLNAIFFEKAALKYKNLIIVGDLNCTNINWFCKTISLRISPLSQLRCLTKRHQN
ncbi:hypothetical protein BpHYR1_003377, partial [Brachionus plicatilis]